MYLFPFAVNGNGPMRSIPTCRIEIHECILSYNVYSYHAYPTYFMPDLRSHRYWMEHSIALNKLWIHLLALLQIILYLPTCCANKSVQIFFPMFYHYLGENLYKYLNNAFKILFLYESNKLMHFNHNEILFY